jgi:hypothetical protein
MQIRRTVAPPDFLCAAFNYSKMQPRWHFDQRRKEFKARTVVLQSWCMGRAGMLP